MAYLILFWLACGIISAGFWFPTFDDVWIPLYKYRRSSTMAFALGMCALGGPFALGLTVNPKAGMREHGWRLWGK